MFTQQAATAPNTMNTQPATAIGQTGQTGAQPSLFTGFGQQTQQQSHPTQSLFGSLGQTQQQQPANQGGGAPSLFGSSATQPPTGGTPAFGSGAWNTGNPLLPRSAFGTGIATTGQAQIAAGLGTSLFGQQQPPPQQQQQSTGFGSSFLAPTQNQMQQTYGACFLVLRSSDKVYVY
jgi:hypothetical protein